MTGDHAGRASDRIIFLNGTSGSGRTGIARKLLDVLDDGVLFHLVHLAVDGFNAMRTGRGLWAEQLDTALRRTGEGLHRSIAAMAGVGDDIVVGHVLSEPWRLPDCPTVLSPEDVLFVGVPVRRTTRPGASRPGATARRSSRRTSTICSTPTATTPWCDTGTAGPRECARRIKEFLPHRPGPTAFTRLRLRRRRPAAGRAGKEQTRS